jgi:hypothetical protein
MQKEKISMEIRKAITIIFVVVLVVTSALVAFRFAASETTVCINPAEKNVYLRQTFTINVEVVDVWALQAYSIIIYYNTIPIDVVSVEIPSRHLLEPLSAELPLAQENFQIINREIDDNFNTTHGRICISAKLHSTRVLQRPHCKMREIRQVLELGITGSGTLFTVTFNCTDKGTSFLCLYQTKLWGSDSSSSISHSRINGVIRAQW